MVNFIRPAALAAFLFLVSDAGAQDYQGDYGDEYQQDNLYHDYAMRQQEKETAKG